MLPLPHSSADPAKPEGWKTALPLMVPPLQLCTGPVKPEGRICGGRTQAWHQPQWSPYSMRLGPPDACSAANVTGMFLTTQKD
eukprot:scaffold157709_cov21-Tisochrysis_lutea.AAC.1